MVIPAVEREGAPVIESIEFFKVGQLGRNGDLALSACPAVKDLYVMPL
jgi:hypothetical protein